MDGADLQLTIAIVVEHGEQLELAHQPRRKVLGDEALVLEIAHGEVKRLSPVLARNIREPIPILIGGFLAHTADIAHHRKTQGIRVDARVIRRVETRLGDHVGVRLEDFQDEAVGDLAAIIKLVDKRVVPEGRPAFVHYLRLALRVEVLAKLTHNAYNFPLPRLKERGMLLDEIQNVLLRFFREAFFFLGLCFFVSLARRHRMRPQVVVL